jgi:transposase
LSSLRRLFRANKLSYKRIRKSCRHLRDSIAYEFFRDEVKALGAWAATGEVDLCYCDEMGVSRQAVVPYGWQAEGKSDAFVPATPSGNLTKLGFFYEDNRFEGYLQQGAMSSAMLIECVDDFASRLTRKTILIMDNASTHKSALFESRVSGWRSQGLYIQYIPAYCPELNLIECLWKQIKYHWLNPLDFLTPVSLRAALEDILAGIGTKYRITFG